MVQAATEVKINKRILRESLHDMNKCAKAVDLVYVSNDSSGFTRKRRGKNFIYFNGEERIKDKVELERIKKLSIPPAWNDVWICKLSNGHLQATGYDLLKRKQYRYHTSWNVIRKHTKFYRLKEFGKKLPLIRKSLEQHLALRGYPEEKILAVVVSLLEQTNIRIGNSFYEKLYGSFGLTTLKNRHVKITGSQMRFTFKGKKGVKHDITLKSKRLARIVKECKDMPGKELFEFYDDEGNIHNIDSGKVNNYIRTITEGEFSAKDFRTWSGTLNALMALNELGGFETKTEMNKKVVSAFDMVAEQLGNTRTVCKNYYVHPIVVELYKENKLKKHLDKLDLSDIQEQYKDLMPEERLLLEILEKN